MSLIVDSDTHIAESQGMWKTFPPDLLPRRPVLVSGPTDTLYGTKNVFWLIDGNIFPKPAGKGGFSLITPSESVFQRSRGDIAIACRECTDVPARLADMDRQGVDVQVIYPTLFLVYLTDDVDLEVALCAAYNDWLASVWAQSNNRIRWTAVLPLRSREASIEQLRAAREHGAVGVFFRGVERDRTLDDPYFFPIYEEAQALDLPICIHTGAGCPAITAIFDVSRNSSFPHIRMQPLIAFRDLVANRIPEQFPRLRFGFVEAGASWVPYVLHAVKRLLKDDPARYGPSLFKQYRLYVACEADEDIPYLTQFVGEDHLLIGSDYGHNDPSEEPELVKVMRAREDVPARVTDKIFGANAQRFYAL
jgi:predicted TIM-barrel fold metal-dependent hydrolase